MTRKESSGKVTSTHRALRDVAFERTRDLIVTGEVAPGERLIEEALGQRLGMSRNPVRESLKILEREGFVTISPFRGGRLPDRPQGGDGHLRDPRAAGLVRRRAGCTQVHRGGSPSAAQHPVGWGQSAGEG